MEDPFLITWETKISWQELFNPPPKKKIEDKM